MNRSLFFHLTITSAPLTTSTITKTKTIYVFVAQLKTGSYIVGQSTNPSKRLCAINSGLNPSIPEKLMIHRIAGIKEITEERNLILTFKKLEARLGKGNVIAV